MSQHKLTLPPGNWTYYFRDKDTKEQLCQPRFLHVIEETTVLVGVPLPLLINPNIELHKEELPND